MPELAAIGRFEDVETEPVTIPIVGYLEDKTEVVTKIRFRASAPIGYALEMIKATGPTGKISNAAAIEYIDRCVYPDDRDEWDSLLKSDSIYLDQRTIAQVYEALGEFYTNRPTPQRSASPRGQSDSEQTSRAAAFEPVSTDEDSPLENG